MDEGGGKDRSPTNHSMGGRGGSEGGKRRIGKKRKGKGVWMYKRRKNLRNTLERRRRKRWKRDEES